MHFTAEPVAIRGAIEAILAGEELQGRSLDLDDLLTALRSEAAAGRSRFIVENAILHTGRPKPDTLIIVDMPVVEFIRCTFVGERDLRFQGCSIRALRFKDVTSYVDIVFFNSAIAELVFEHLETHGVVRLNTCRFQNALPRIWNCRFHGKLEIDEARLSGWREPRPYLWRIVNSQFHDALTLEVLQQALRFDFDACTFEGNCRADICASVLEGARFASSYSVLPRQIYLQLNNCSVLGELITRQEPRSKSFFGSIISIRSTAVDGVIDLTGVSVASLDVTDTSFASGRLNIDWGQLQHADRLLVDSIFWQRLSQWMPRMVWQQLSRLFCPADFLGVLLSEQLKRLSPEQASTILGLLPQPPDTDNKLIAKEYGALRNSFARVAEAGDLEAFCHYKHKCYHNRAERELRGRQASAQIARMRRSLQKYLPSNPRLSRVPGPLAFALTAVLMAFAVMARLTIDNRWIGGLQIVAWRVSAALSAAVFAILPWIAAVFWKRCLGYGMYARRVVGTAAAIIITYALFYTTVSMCSGGDNGIRMGDCLICEILREDHNALPAPHILPVDVQVQPGIKDDPAKGITLLVHVHEKNRPILRRDSAGTMLTLARALYYSVVTFTTLGYGDYAPHGFWMRLAAGSEALLGAVMLAFLTVVLARKFIR